MDLMILKKKIDGYRSANGSIKKLQPELLLELRQTWEHYTGTPEQFRSELGVKMGTLRNLLKESKKLNHVLAGADALGLAPIDQARVEEASLPGIVIEVTIVDGAKVIRFPTVDLLVDFMKKSA